MIYFQSRVAQRSRRQQIGNVVAVSVYTVVAFAIVVFVVVLSRLQGLQ